MITYAQLKRMQTNFEIDLPDHLLIPMRPEDFFCFWICQHGKRLQNVSTAFPKCDPGDVVLTMYLNYPEIVEDRHN